ncbi:hypothetical protein ACU8KH_03691 [Lachancea thermotolerans]
MSAAHGFGRIWRGVPDRFFWASTNVRTKPSQLFMLDRNLGARPITGKNSHLSSSLTYI